MWTIISPANDMIYKRSGGALRVVSFAGDNCPVIQSGWDVAIFGDMVKLSLLLT